MAEMMSVALPRDDSQTDETGMKSEASPAGAGVEILIVEDSPTQAKQLEQILARQGYEVRTTRDGREALDALRARLPTIVITDINMPEMDGYELCRKIKSDEGLKELPVMLLTSLSDPKDILKGLECGADNFIVKPYDTEFLLSRIQYILVNQELRRNSGPEGGTEIFFAGEKYRLPPDRLHSIDLLLSTYETAVQKNIQLSQAKKTLEMQAVELREKNAEMAADLNMARELQVAFLPHNYPTFPPGVPEEQSAVHFCHRYSTRAELGGDFFDILKVSETQAGILVCDVMGHGVRSALVTAIVRGLLEELTPFLHDPGALLTELNRSLVTIFKHALTRLFVSGFYVVIDAASGTIRYANAGHPFPIHVRRDKSSAQYLNGAKPSGAMGMTENFVYSTFEAQLAEHDSVMLFTDGLYEVEGADRVYYTKEQLLEAVRRRTHLRPPEIFNEVLAEVRAFSAGKQFEDDVCLVGVEFAARQSLRR
jgi:serine phosphatase RsbU (regulator of sigma subunit)/ActR/RegA family two-component response regulator